jgi:putative N6-adenine-specific DNA methylase
VQPLSIFAVAAPGLEAAVVTELGTLGIHAEAETGGASWDGPADDVARANLELRTASRILVRVAEFRSRTFHELERKARRVDWQRFLAEGESARLRVTCRKSALYHEGAVAERIADSITERTGCRAVAGTRDDEADAVDPGQLFVIRMFRDVCTISADTSGDLLHRRGYREAVAKAPLRETIAAAMLLSSGWTRDLPLLDPLCGSGTIAIEAALIARCIAPGIALVDREPRAFRFLDWPSRPDVDWDARVARARDVVQPAAPAPILASDRNPGAIRAAIANAQRAGVAGDIEFATRPLSAVTPPAPAGWIVTNPPYGHRIGNRRGARQVSKEIARLRSDGFSGWNVATLEPGAIRDGSDATAFETRNGGIAVALRVRAAGS